MPIPEEPTADFKCPKCGSSRYGTSMRPLPVTVHCHGRVGCRFKLVDADRWKYFELRGEPFAGPAQYEAHLARWLDQQNETIARTD